MKRYNIHEKHLCALREAIIKDIIQTVVSILSFGGDAKIKTITLDLCDDTVNELSLAHTSVTVCDSGECDVEQREMIAEISISADGTGFSVKTEYGSVKNCASVETDDLAALLFGLEMAEIILIRNGDLEVTDGTLRGIQDDES